MTTSHLIALIPLGFFFLVSLLWYSKGIIHLITLAYVVILAFFAITRGWEALFWPILVGVGAISMMLFVASINKGEWY